MSIILNSKPQAAHFQKLVKLNELKTTLKFGNLIFTIC